MDPTTATIIGFATQTLLIATLFWRINGRFDKINDRFDAMNSHFNDRFDAMNGHFNDRFDRMNDRMATKDDLNKAEKRLERDIGRVEGQVKDLSTVVYDNRDRLIRIETCLHLRNAHDTPDHDPAVGNPQPHNKATGRPRRTPEALPEAAAGHTSDEPPTPGVPQI